MLHFIDNSLKKIEELIVAGGILLATSIIIFNVITRYFFNFSWTPAEELSLITIIVSTFIGSSYAARKGSHILMGMAFDLNLLSRRQKYLLMAINSFLIGVICMVVGYFGLQYVLRLYKIGKVTPALNIPYWIINMSFPIGFWLMGLQWFRNCFVNLKTKSLRFGPEGETSLS